MSAQIIQFVPRPNPNRRPTELELWAMGVVDQIAPEDAGNVILQDSVWIPDMIHYHNDGKEPA